MEGRMGNGLILGLHLAEIRDARARRLVPRAEPEDREVPLLGAITRIVRESPSGAHGRFGGRSAANDSQMRGFRRSA